MHLCARRQPPGREDARAPRPRMLTQPGCSHPFRATRMLLVLPKGESKALVAAEPLAVWGSLRHSLHTPPPHKGNLARVDEMGGSGRWRRNSGFAAPRAQLTPKLEGTCSARGGRGAAAAASAAGV